VELALLDQRGEFGLWFTEAPRRTDAHPEAGSLAAVGRVEFEVLWCCHGAPQVVVTGSAQWMAIALRLLACSATARTATLSARNPLAR
jgi:hypothetical protein